MSADIAPDVNGPHCGWVIACKHNAGIAYPPHCITPRPEIPDEVWKFFGHTGGDM